MTITPWLDAPQVPPRLSARVREVLHGGQASVAAPAPAAALLDVGTALLRSVLDASSASPRSVALDLLAADACVTWAFEAAAQDAPSVPTLADAVMHRLAQEAR